MIYDLSFYYRIDKEAGAGEDSEGNPGDLYVEVKLGECDTETRDYEAEKRAHEDVKTIGSILGIDTRYITPISREEFETNAEESEGE